MKISVTDPRIKSFKGFYKILKRIIDLYFLNIQDKRKVFEYYICVNFPISSSGYCSKLTPNPSIQLFLTKKRILVAYLKLIPLGDDTVNYKAP